MKAIDHAAEARKHIDWAHEQQGRDGEYDWTVRDNALIAQAEATLALAEQQQTANRIAYLAMVTATINAGKATDVDTDAIEALAAAACEGLGLA